MGFSPAAYDGGDQQKYGKPDQKEFSACSYCLIVTNANSYVAKRKFIKLAWRSHTYAYTLLIVQCAPSTPSLVIYDEYIYIYRTQAHWMSHKSRPGVSQFILFSSVELQIRSERFPFYNFLLLVSFSFISSFFVFVLLF